MDGLIIKLYKFIRSVEFVNLSDLDKKKFVNIYDLFYIVDFWISLEVVVKLDLKFIDVDYMYDFVMKDNGVFISI